LGNKIESLALKTEVKSERNGTEKALQIITKRYVDGRARTRIVIK